jgi:hypothetical protein
MSARLIDHGESRRKLWRDQDKRFLNRNELDVREVRGIRCEEIDRTRRAVVVIVWFYFGTRFRFQMRQVRKMRVDESAAFVIGTRVQMEHRPVHDCQQQRCKGGTGGDATHAVHSLKPLAYEPVLVERAVALCGTYSRGHASIPS